MGPQIMSGASKGGSCALPRLYYGPDLLRLGVPSFESVAQDGFGRRPGGSAPRLLKETWFWASVWSVSELLWRFRSGENMSSALMAIDHVYRAARRTLILAKSCSAAETSWLRPEVDMLGLKLLAQVLEIAAGLNEQL